MSIPLIGLGKLLDESMSLQAAINRDTCIEVFLYNGCMDLLLLSE